MSLPELLDGDVVFTRSVKQYLFDQNGAPVMQANFNSGRKRKFVFVLLGAVDDGKETSIDLEAMMKRHGWVRDPELK